MAFAFFVIIAAIAAAVAGFYYSFTKGVPVQSWLTEYAYAHRGLHGGSIPENSMRAFEEAAAAGYGIELDVHLSHDGIPIVFHDDNLKRMTGLDRNVSDLSAEELERLSLAGSGAGISRFADVLKMVGGRVPILVELKNTGRAGMLEEKTYELLHAYNGKYAVQSFSPFSIKWFRKNAPGVLRGQLSAQLEELKGYIPKYQILGLRHLFSNFWGRPNFISYDVGSLPKRVVSRLRKKGVSILGWTVTSEELREKACKYCDSVIFEAIRP